MLLCKINKESHPSLCETLIPLPQLEVFDYVFLMTASAKSWCDSPSALLCSPQLSLTRLAVLSSHVFVWFFLCYTLSSPSTSSVLCSSKWRAHHTHTHAHTLEKQVSSWVWNHQTSTFESSDVQQKSACHRLNLSTFWRHPSLLETHDKVTKWELV